MNKFKIEFTENELNNIRNAIIFQMGTNQETAKKLKRIGVFNDEEMKDVKTAIDEQMETVNKIDKALNERR